MKNCLKVCHFKDAIKVKKASNLHCRGINVLASRNVSNGYTYAGSM
jgi:hypothetical protein